MRENGKWMAGILCLLCLCGCQKQPERAPAAPVPEQQEVAQAPLQEAPQQEVPAVIAVEMEVKESPVWSGSEPQQGSPVTPQPGDTTLSWDPGRAAQYPPDSDCEPLQLLEKWLAVEGLGWDDLQCEQLILVVAGEEDGVSSRAYCYSKSREGVWSAEPELSDLPGFVGSRGIAHDRRRSSLQSPAGLWSLGSAFGLAEEPEGLKVPWRDITEQSDWVCDDESLYFNTWQERDDLTLEDSWNWNDTEHLADYDKTYTYACIIEYNTPPYVVPDRGCAIFLHVSDHPTEGCVGLLTEDMVRVLQWLDPHRSPHILITGWERK